jgi:hypothetical protein
MMKKLMNASRPPPALHMEKKNKTSISPDLYLTILESVKKYGKLPDLDIPKTHRNYYVSRLKKQGRIKRISYGVWEVKTSISPPPRVTTNHLGLPCAIDLKKQVRSDDVRVHNLMFRLKLETPLSWESRLKARSVPFSRLKFGVLQIVHDNHKVWLCNGKVIIYVPAGLDYTARKVSKSLLLAVKDFFHFLPGLEAFLGFSLRSEEGYVWNVTRKHLSLVKNALAQDYNERKEKLRFYDEKGLWMLADDSFNLGELEFVRSSTNQGETNVIQAFFNDLKKNPVKPSELLQIAQAQAYNHSQLMVTVGKLAEVVKLIKNMLEGR